MLVWMAVCVRSSTWVTTLYWTSYATNETSDLMPLTHVLSTKQGENPTEVSNNGTYSWLRLARKIEATIEYKNESGAWFLYAFTLFSSPLNIMR